MEVKFIFWDYKEKEWYKFECNWDVFMVSDEFTKNTSQLPEKAKEKILDYMYNEYGGWYRIQKLKNPDEFYVYDENDYFIIDLPCEDTDLSSNQNNTMTSNTIEQYKRKTFFTDEKIAQIAELVDKASEIESYLDTVVDKVRKVNWYISSIVHDLSIAVDSWDYKV